MLVTCVEETCIHVRLCKCGRVQPRVHMTLNVHVHVGGGLRVHPNYV